MAEPAKPAAVLIPAAVCVCVVAVLFAGLGGLLDDPWRTLCGAGVLFCGLMLMVFWIIASNGQSLSISRRLSWVFGALLGLCYALFMAPGEGLLNLLLHIGGGAIVGRFSHLMWEVRQPEFWDGD